MNLESCFVCGRPVLELAGQFDKFDSYLLRSGDEARSARAFGWCHCRCLVEGPWGRFWADRIYEQAIGTIGFRPLDRVGAYRLAELPRTAELLGIRDDGFYLRIKASLRQRATTDGALVPVDEECNLELDDPALLERVRRTLERERRFPLLELVEALGLSDTLLHPQALERGELRFDRALRREWRGQYVAGRNVYERFVPSEMLPALERLRGR